MQASNSHRLYSEFVRKICAGELKVSGEYKKGVTNDDKVKIILREIYDEFYRSFGDYNSNLNERISAAKNAKGGKK